jgi:hypothetical protein
VDNFFGTHFESDFTLLQEKNTQRDEEFFTKIFTNPKLYRKLAPKILLDGKQIDHFIANGHIPGNFTPIALGGRESIFTIGLKFSHDEMLDSIDRDWEVEISKDLRLATMISLLKAAHLTLFSLLGYSYIFTAAGEFVGRQVLGEFYRQNFNKSKSNILENAHMYFQEFVHMIRPILVSNFPLTGTISDRKVLLCRGTGETAWAIIVIIRTDQQLNAVMIPASSNPNMIDTYLSFLRNKNESINVSVCQLNQNHWNVSPERIPMLWPKTGMLYP